MAKNLIYREVDEQNSGFKLEGEPHHRQQTATFVSQQINVTYRGTNETGVPMWTNRGIPAYNNANAGFIPFGTTFISEDNLPLNRTFEELRFQPSGTQGNIKINVEEQLEFRKLICTEKSRQKLERVSFPQEELTMCGWKMVRR